MPIDVRRRISHKQANTWRYRDGVDRYSGVLRGDVRDPETDHVIEIQIINDAVNRAIKVPSMANACAEIDVVRVFNDTCNLNVTSRKINQAKKGPIRACMNNYRLVQERGLRALSLESAARRGTARWLVDEGHLERIVATMRNSYDECAARLYDEGFADKTSTMDEIDANLYDALHHMKIL